MTRVDKVIITILIKVAELLTKYSKNMGAYEVYQIRSMIDEIEVDGDGNQEWFWIPRSR